MFQVEDVMTDSVVAVSPEATVHEAINKLLEYKVSGLPVVDDNGTLLGVISELDIIDLVYEASLDECHVADHMTRDVKSLSPEASLDDAADIFCTRSIRRIPITQDGRLVGVISRRDLIRFVRDSREPVAV